MTPAEWPSALGFLCAESKMRKVLICQPSHFLWKRRLSWALAVTVCGQNQESKEWQTKVGYPGVEGNTEMGLPEE